MEEKNITSPRQATVEQPDVANAETNTSPLNNTQLSTPKDDVLSPNVALDVTDGTMDITSNVINELTVITPDIADETADTKLGLESELVDVTRVDEAATDVVERSEGGTAENLESTLIVEGEFGFK